MSEEKIKKTLMSTFFLVRNNFSSLKDSSTIEYTEDGLDEKLTCKGKHHTAMSFQKDKSKMTNLILQLFCLSCHPRC